MSVRRRIVTFCVLLINKTFVTDGIQTLLIQIFLARLPFLFFRYNIVYPMQKNHQYYIPLN